MTPTLLPWELGLLLLLTILLTGVQAVACGAWAQLLAQAKGHSAIKWFWLGFFLSAAGVICADNLPALITGGKRCSRGFLCSELCARVNRCNGCLQPKS